MTHATLPIAVHVFLIKDKQVLMMLRKGTGFQDGKWSVPAGRLNTGETITMAAIRESMEEVGVKIKQGDLSDPLFMHHHDERGERLYAFFTCKTWAGEPKNIEPDVCDEIKWIKLDNTSTQDTVSHVNFALNKILQGETYVEYGF